MADSGIPIVFSLGLKAFALNSSSSELYALYESTLNELLEHSFVIIKDTDEKLRAIYVGIQSIVERYLTYLLATNSITQIAAFIHTPLPPTPLCKQPDDSVDDTLVSVDVKSDPKRLLTVTERAIYLREYLNNCGILCAIYPQSGLARRAVKEQEIYKSTLETYKNLVIDCPLNIDIYPEDLVGATYFFTTDSGTSLTFSIKSYQAVDTQGEREWGLWLGSANHEMIKQHLSEIGSFLKGNCQNEHVSKYFNF